MVPWCRLFLNGKGWYIWTSESDCKNLGSIQSTPSLCTGPSAPHRRLPAPTVAMPCLSRGWMCVRVRAAGFFKAYRGNVSLPNGYTLERWSPTPGNNHSIFFEPTTCNPKRSFAALHRNCGSQKAVGRRHPRVGGRARVRLATILRGDVLRRAEDQARSEGV